MDGSLGALYLQQLINGLTVGALYALIALGYTMVYGVLEMINFAHGDVFMVGSFLGLVVLALLGPSGPPGGLAIVLVAVYLGAMVGCGARRRHRAGGLPARPERVPARPPHLRPRRFAVHPERGHAAGRGPAQAVSPSSFPSSSTTPAGRCSRTSSFCCWRPRCS